MTRLYLVFVLLILFACDDTTKDSPLHLQGSIKGNVRLYSQYGNLANDHSGAKVIFSGKDGDLSATTDASGNYTISNVFTDTYNLVISKDGYVSSISNGVKVVGGPEPLFLSGTIVGVCTSTVTDVTLSYSSGYVVDGTIHSESPNGTVVVIFFGTTPDVSPTNYLSAASTSFGGTSLNYKTSSFSTLSSGTTLYAVAYCNSNILSTEYDFETKKSRYLYLGSVASNTASIVVK